MGITELNSNKDQYQNEVLKSIKNFDNILFEWVTGTGKTKMAIKFLEDRKAKRVLIIVPNRVLIDNWKKELGEKYNEQIDIVCIGSAYKLLDNTYDVCILDEAHCYLTAVRQEVIRNIKCNSFVLLSATMKEEQKNFYSYMLRCKTNKLMYVDILDTKTALKCNLISDTAKYIIKGIKVLDKSIMFERNKGDYERMSIKSAMSNLVRRCLWGYNMGTNTLAYKSSVIRLKRWYSEFKSLELVKMADDMQNERVIFFCGSIDTCNRLAKMDPTGVSMNDKSMKPKEALNAFNEGKYNHIYTVKMLNQGITPKNCGKVVITQIDKGSKVSLVQQIGRSLRDSNPEIYMLYLDDVKISEFTNNERIIEWDDKSILLKHLEELRINYVEEKIS